MGKSKRTIDAVKFSRKKIEFVRYQVVDGWREMSTMKMNTTEFQNKVLSELATIREMLEAQPVVGKKVKKERKPRDPNAKPNDWIVFTGRVREVLKAANLPAGKECQQFASHLKSSHPNAYEMTDEEIQEARMSWQAPPPKPKAAEAVSGGASAVAAAVLGEEDIPAPKPKRVLSEEQKAKMAAGRKAAAAAKKAIAEGNLDDEAGGATAEEIQQAAALAKSVKKAAAPAPAPAPTTGPSHPVAVEKKLRPLPYKGKKLLWDTETNGTWLNESGEKGAWFGRYNKETRTVDTQAKE